MGVRIGLIGVGRMGMPVCANLARAGYEVTAYDLRTELERDVVASGARWGASSRAVATGADVLVTVLPGPAEVRDALLGPDGALGGELRPAATWIDMSTCPPGAGRELGDHARAQGLRCLDAPIGGDPAVARAGTLQLFVGGDLNVVEEHRDLLEAVAESAEIRHVGAHGAGYLTKLLVNLLWFGQAVATAEALLIARRDGLDLDVLREAIASSSASSEFIRSDLDALLAGDYLRSFRLDRCCEELEAITTLARQLGVPHELTGVVKNTYLRALERYGAADGELLAVALLEEEAGLRLRHSPTSSARKPPVHPSQS
jgi:3-hydroxyisobutyrate dehydrogenase